MKKILFFLMLLFTTSGTFASDDTASIQSCGSISNLLSTKNAELADKFVVKYNEKVSKLSLDEQSNLYNKVNTKLDDFITKYQTQTGDRYVEIVNLLKCIKCMLNSSEGVDNPDVEINSGSIQKLSINDLSDVASGNENVISYESGYIILEIKYPKLGLTGADEIIKGFIYEEIKTFINDMPQEIPYTDGLQYSLYIDYKTTNLDKYSTIKFNLSSFYGGAHPNNYLKTFNFDKKTQKDVSLQEYLTGKTDYLTKLSDVSYKALSGAEGLDDLSRLKEGTFASGDNFQFFNITTGGLTLYFPSYQVGPYAAGEQSVNIKLDEIK